MNHPEKKSRNQSPAAMWKGEEGRGGRGRGEEKKERKKGEPERKRLRSMNRLSRWPSSFGRVSRRGRRQGRLEGGTGRKRSVAPEGYVWVLSRHIPFYHASGLRCPRSRCQENGRIFPLRGELGLGRERETRAESIRGGGGGGSRVEGEGGERERETGIGRVESGRRGKEENTKEKPGWAASLRDR